MSSRRVYRGAARPGPPGASCPGRAKGGDCSAPNRGSGVGTVKSGHKMTGTTATTPRPKDTSALRTMVVCDDREVMRLGLVEMLQAMQWAERPEGIQLAGPGVGLPRGQLGSERHRDSWRRRPPPRNSRRQGDRQDPPPRSCSCCATVKAASLAVAAGLPVDGYFLEEDLSVPMLRSLAGPARRA